MMKEMLRAFILGWLRNAAVLNKDGTKGRGQEDMTINNEPVFFGGMNRAPAYINPAFRRRVAFKTCVQFQRADGVTFEQAKILTRMIAVFETYQQEDQVLSFDQIIARLPEVEKRSVAGERLCLTVLSGLDDVVFPLVRPVQVCGHYQAPC
jgi:hypothetical protein